MTITGGLHGLATGLVLVAAQGAGQEENDQHGRQTGQAETETQAHDVHGSGLLQKGGAKVEGRHAENSD